MFGLRKGRKSLGGDNLSDVVKIFEGRDQRDNAAKNSPRYQPGSLTFLECAVKSDPNVGQRYCGKGGTMADSIRSPLGNYRHERQDPNRIIARCRGYRCLACLSLSPCLTPEQSRAVHREGLTRSQTIFFFACDWG